MIGASGLHGDVNGSIAEIDSMISAVIRGFDDVGPVFGQDPG